MVVRGQLSKKCSQKQQSKKQSSINLAIKYRVHIFYCINYVWISEWKTPQKDHHIETDLNHVYINLNHSGQIQQTINCCLCFLVLFQTTGFCIPCKLSPCMKYQSLFSKRKQKKNISICCLSEFFTQHAKR